MAMAGRYISVIYICIPIMYVFTLSIFFRILTFLKPTLNLISLLLTSYIIKIIQRYYSKTILTQVQYCIFNFLIQVQHDHLVRNSEWQLITHCSLVIQMAVMVSSQPSTSRCTVSSSWDTQAGTTLPHTFYKILTQRPATWNTASPVHTHQLSAPLLLKMVCVLLE